MTKDEAGKIASLARNAAIKRAEFAELKHLSRDKSGEWETRWSKWHEAFMKFEEALYKHVTFEN